MKPAAQAQPSISAGLRPAAPPRAVFSDKPLDGTDAEADEEPVVKRAPKQNALDAADDALTSDLDGASAAPAAPADPLAAAEAAMA